MTGPDALIADALIADAAMQAAQIRTRAARTAALDLQRDIDAETIDEHAANASARRVTHLIAEAEQLTQLADRIIAGEAAVTTDLHDDLGGLGETPKGGKPSHAAPPLAPAITHLPADEEDPATGALPEDEPDTVETVLAAK